jgi:glycine cleavage system regulatory protein
MLIEIDLEANPIKSLDTVLQTIVTKKDLLVFNLKRSILAKENPNDLFAPASASTQDQTQILEEAKALMAMSHNGVLYKSKRVYQKIRAHF